MQNEMYIPIDELVQKEIKDRVKEAVEAKWIECYPSRDKTSARQDAITLLYWYPTVKHALLDRQDEEREILDYLAEVQSLPPSKRSKAEKSKVYSAKMFRLDAVQADIIKLGGYVRDVERALDKIKDEPYYHLVYDRYVLELTDLEIVEKHKLASRHLVGDINKTLDVIKFYLCPMKALREAITIDTFRVGKEIKPKPPTGKKRGRPRKNKTE